MDTPPPPQQLKNQFACTRLALCNLTHTPNQISCRLFTIFNLINLIMFSLLY
jgi:hypothetical protein